jgi:hypothetical protein
MSTLPCDSCGQKGGTGKSTLARAFAVEAAKRDSRVLIADLDEAQRTSWDWGRRRAANSLLPEIDGFDRCAGPHGPVYRLCTGDPGIWRPLDDGTCPESLH